MIARSSAALVWGALAVGMLLAACSPTPSPTTSVPVSSNPVPEASQGASTSASQAPGSSGLGGVAFNPLPAGFTFGSGAVVIRDPASGLAELSSYRATLSESFDGTADGKAATWWTARTRAETRSPVARELAVDSSGDSAPVQPSRSWLAEGIGYASFGGGACAASSKAAAADPIGELVNRLPPVLGAVSSGAEQVNGIDAIRSTFDGAAIGLGKAGTAAGTVWIAASGGFVARYELTIKAGVAFFGPGIDGTWTARYDLKDVGAVAPIAPPAACGTGPVDAPIMDGATDVVRSSGVLSYQVSAGLDAVKSFYESGAQGLGWTSAHEAQQTDTALVLEYTSDDGRVTVFATVSGGATTVRILVDA